MHTKHKIRYTLCSNTCFWLGLKAGFVPLPGDPIWHVSLYLRSASYARVLAMIACPSVCLSDTRQYCVKTAKRRIT